jgi:phosphatidylglycerol:prolipoprotein diacylglycerol transferase
VRPLEERYEKGFAALLGWEVIPRIGFRNFTISPHGLGIALGYFLGTLLLARRARERGFSEDHAWNAAAVSVIGAILGARIAYVMGHLSEFSSPIEWLQIYRGGISLVGGLLGGFLAAYLYVRKQGIDFLQLADLGAPGIAIGIAIGRIGDLLIGDHLGKQTSGWWGWEYRGGELISPPPCNYATPDGCIQTGMVVHQTALYDMIWSLAIFGLLLALERKPRPKGFLVLAWASLYAVGRIATDFTRVDKEWFGLGLTGSQLTAVVVLAICSYLLVKRRRLEPAPAGMPGAAAVPVDEAATDLEAEAMFPAPAAAESPEPAAAEAAPEPTRRGRSRLSERVRDRARPAARPVGETEQATKSALEGHGPTAAGPTGAPSERVGEAPMRPAPSIPDVPEGESVFRASRERARARTEGPASRRPAARPIERPRPPRVSDRPPSPTRGDSPASRRSPKEEPAREEPVATELDEFDWEP